MKRFCLIALLTILSLQLVITPASAQSADAKLTADDNAAGDKFGWSVSASGNIIVVGAWGDNDNGMTSGSAYVFRDTDTGWTQVAKLTADDSTAGDRFGWSVSASGNIIVVGAWGDDDNGSTSGSAYVFSDTDSGWTQTAKLTADDSAAGDEFGYAVAISGSTIVVGAPADDDNGACSGSAYVFRDTDSGWTQTAKLTASDGTTGDVFGNAVAIEGSTIAVGARYDDDKGESAGSAYVFRDTDAGWTQTAKLTAGDSAEGDRFGYAVAISGSTTVVGAWEDDDNGESSGSAYVFNNADTGWTQTAKLIANDNAEGDRCGYAVAISGSTIVAGAPADDDNGANSGSVYVFRDTDTGWTQAAKFNTSDSAAGDEFGNAVAIEGSTIVVGARYDDDNGESSGSAYVYQYSVTYLINKLIDQVANLDLTQSIENKLNAKIDVAEKAIDDLNENNDAAAINAMEAFINQIEAQRGKKISNEDADTLISQAQAIIAFLESGL